MSVITGDIVDYDFEPASFDRVVSIELFEHMKNYELLMAKVARALAPGGKVFVHIFAHRTTPYDFEEGWMSTHFFTGGNMPSADLLLYFQNELKVQEQWWVNGRHYAQTCEVSHYLPEPPSCSCDGRADMQKDWLSKMNASKKELWPHLVDTYGEKNAAMWFFRWQIFYMACAELFAYEGGDVWGITHYLFQKPYIESST